MKSPAKLTLSAVIVVLLAAGGWWYSAKSAAAAIVVAHLPAVPSLTGAHAELVERIGQADDDALSLPTARDGLAELSRLYHANGYLDTAMLTYAGLAELEPHEPRWPHLHATILAGFGQAAPAVALWDQAIELAPDYLPAQLRRADLLLKDNQTAAAETAYRQVLEQERDNAWALLGLARLNLEAENWRDARTQLERVVALTNYNLGYDLVVSLYERLGETRAAEAIRGRAAASGAYRDPIDPWLDELMADCYDSFRLALEAGAKARHGDNATALRWLQRAIEVAPNDVSAHFQMAGHLKSQRDLEGAMLFYRRCTQLDPQFADGWAQLSALLAQVGQPTQADRILAQGLENCPDSPGLHRMNARRLRDSGQVGAALAEFRTAIRLRPNEPDPYLELGVTLLGMDRRDEGMRQIENALVWDPLNPTGLGILAFDAIETKNRDQADHWMSQIDLQPRLESTQVNRLRDVYRQAFGEPWDD